MLVELSGAHIRGRRTPPPPIGLGNRPRPRSVPRAPSRGMFPKLHRCRSRIPSAANRSGDALPVRGRSEEVRPFRVMAGGRVCPPEVRGPDGGQFANRSRQRRTTCQHLPTGARVGIPANTCRGGLERWVMGGRAQRAPASPPASDSRDRVHPSVAPVIRPSSPEP
jgi:hypothetical protein